MRGGRDLFRMPSSPGIAQWIIIHHARVEIQLRALYRQMQDNYYDTALRILEHRAAQGGGPQQ